MASSHFTSRLRYRSNAMKSQMKISDEAAVQMQAVSSKLLAFFVSNCSKLDVNSKREIKL